MKWKLILSLFCIIVFVSFVSADWVRVEGAREDSDNFFLGENWFFGATYFLSNITLTNVKSVRVNTSLVVTDLSGRSVFNVSANTSSAKILINGSVGIDTTSPNSSLHLGGAGVNKGLMLGDGSIQLYANAIPTTSWLFKDGASIRGSYANGRIAMSAYGSNNLPSFYDYNDANTGYALWSSDVLSLMAGGTHILTVNNTALGSTNVDILKINTSTGVRITQTGTVDYSNPFLHVNGADSQYLAKIGTMALFGNGNIKFGGTSSLGITGTTINNKNLLLQLITGNNMIPLSIMNRQYTNDPVLNTSYFAVTSGALNGANKLADVFVIDKDGKVGIGNAYPTQKLEVNGTVYATDTSTGFSTLGGITIGNGKQIQNVDNDAELRFNSGSLVTFHNFTISGAGLLSTGTGNSYFMGSVGIGTTSPTQRLDVNGSFHATNITIHASDNQSQLMCLNVTQSGVVSAYAC